MICAECKWFLPRMFNSKKGRCLFNSMTSDSGARRIQPKTIYIKDRNNVCILRKESDEQEENPSD